MLSIKECFDLLPKRYHEEFVIDVLVDYYSIRSLNKVFSYYIEDISNELSEKEKNHIMNKFWFISL